MDYYYYPFVSDPYESYYTPQVIGKSVNHTL